MAVRFDAAADGYSTTVGIPGSTYTVVLWMKLTVDRNTWSTLLHFSGTVNHYLESDSDGTTMHLDGGSANPVGTFAATVGTWYAYAATADGTAGAVLFGTDPAALSKTTGTIVAKGATTTLAIGKEAGDGQFVNGCIAALKIWDAVLSDAEIADELTQYQPRRTANLVRFHPFVNAETADYSGNGYTLTGGTATTEPGPPVQWGPSQVVLDLPPEAATATGSIAGTLPAAAGSITGTASAAGSLAGTLSALTGSISGSAAAGGAVTGSVPALTGTISGAAATAGSVTSTSPAATAALSGSSTVTGATVGQLPLATASLTGTATASGALQGASPAATGTATGTASTAGALSASLPPLAGSVAGLISQAGTLGGTIPAVTGSFAAVVDAGGATLSAGLPAPVAGLSGSLSTSGPVTGTLLAPTLTLTGAAIGVGELTIALPIPALALAGAASVAGALHGATPSALAAWTGNSGLPDEPVQAGPPIVTTGPHTLAPAATVGPRASAPVVTAGPHAPGIPPPESALEAGPPIVTRTVTSGPLA